MVKALYAGSFDPVTMGHVNIIERASKMFDELIITIATNTSKKPLFASDEKIKLVSESINHLPNVKVVSHPSGLTVDYAKDNGIHVMVRGIRSVKDMEYEMDIAAMNSTQEPDIETVFLMADAKYRFLSSSLLKEIAQFNGKLDGLVPDNVAEAMKTKYKS